MAKRRSVFVADFETSCRSDSRMDTDGELSDHSCSSCLVRQTEPDTSQQQLLFIADRLSLSDQNKYNLTQVVLPVI